MWYCKALQVVAGTLLQLVRGGDDEGEGGEDDHREGEECQQLRQAAGPRVLQGVPQPAPHLATHQHADHPPSFSLSPPTWWNCSRSPPPPRSPSPWSWRSGPCPSHSGGSPPQESTWEHSKPLHVNGQLIYNSDDKVVTYWVWVDVPVIQILFKNWKKEYQR